MTRTALNKLISSGFILKKSTNKYLHITICKYGDYQDVQNGEQPTTNQQLTNKQPTTNQQLTTNKEYKEIKNKKNINNNPNGLAESESKKPKTMPIDYEKLVNYFNSETKGRFGNVRIPLSDARKKMVRARINEHGKEAFQEVISKAIKSDFLSGQTGFMMTFDWMIKPSNFEKILSGNYENRQANGSNSNNSDRGSNRNNPIGTAKGKVFETVL